MLHIYHNILSYTSQNTLQRGAAVIEYKYYKYTSGVWKKVRSIHKDMQTYLVPLLALRSILVHMLISWFYTVRFLQVHSLAQDSESRPVVFSKLGLGSMHDLPSIAGQMVIVYLLFFVLVFQLMPFALLYLAYFIAWLLYAISTRGRVELHFEEDDLDSMV
jgi:hypothetical protein